MNIKKNNFAQEDDGVSGEFTVELSSARVRLIVDEGYCIQFNKGGTGKLYYVCLVKTERDPSEIEIDFSSKGFTTQGTKIIDGNGNILENGRCMLCGEYDIKLTSTECTRSSRPIPSTPTTTFRSATNTKKNRPDPGPRRRPDNPTGCESTQAIPTSAPSAMPLSTSRSRSTTSPTTPTPQPRPTPSTPSAASASAKCVRARSTS